jgi:beta-galactosidase
MQPHKTAIKADNEDLAIITVSTLDERKQWVPDADSEIRFTIDGPGRIIGVGNGNPSSIEPDRYIDSVAVVNVSDWTMKQIDSKASLAGILETNDAAKASDISDNHNEYANLYRGTFNLNKKSQPVTVTMFLAKNGPKTNVFLNGKLLKRDTSDLDEILIAPSLLKEGRNTLAIVTKKSNNNSRPGNELVTIQIRKQADQWKRKLFNGLAQVIIQSTGEPGEIVLKAASNDLKGEVKIPSRQTPTLMKE